MGFLTTKAKVWYPALTDKMQLHTLFSTLASSIENGLGPRLERQEIAVGLKVSINQGGWAIPAGGATTVVPYSMTNTRGDFNNGFSFAAGVATVQTSGMYLVTASIGPAADTSTGGKGVKISVEKNGVFVAGNEAPGAVAWLGSTVTCVVNCVPGDTIRAKAGITNATGATNNNDNSTHMSIALVQALPS